jgi:hypothetical protein
VPGPDLDAWLPEPQVLSRHRRTSSAESADLWRAAREIRLNDTRTLGRLVRWRIPGTPPDLRFAELFARYPFAVLDEGPDWSISGLCGPIWTMARDYGEIDRDAFRTWDRPGTVRVLFGHWVEPGEPRSALVSEARVAPTDRFGRLQLRALWVIVGRFERVIAAEPLPLAVARAEGGRGAPEADVTPAARRRGR